MIGLVHKISVNVITGADHSLVINGKLCLERLGQSVARATYAGYADALGVPAGQASFIVPSQIGRVSVGAGEEEGMTTRVVGEVGGSETVTLQPSEMPSHTHAINCDDRNYLGTQHKPGNNYMGSSPVDRTSGDPITNLYSTEQNGATMAAGSIASTGGGGAHGNMQPFIADRFFVQVEA